MKSKETNQSQREKVRNEQSTVTAHSTRKRGRKETKGEKQSDRGETETIRRRDRLSERGTGQGYQMVRRIETHNETHS